MDISCTIFTLIPFKFINLEEGASLQQAQANVNAAMQAAQQATTQLK